MASTNQSPKYIRAQSKFLTASTDREKIQALEEMIKECPKHKSSEKMLANLKTRYKKLRLKLEKQKTIRKARASSSKQAIKKSDMQAVIIGKTNSGKSSVLSVLTNAKPEISKSELTRFTTKSPVVGIMNYQGIQIQLIENPDIESEYYDRGLTNSADVLLIIITDLEDLEKINPLIEKLQAQKIIIYNKIDLLDNQEKRKISENLASKLSKEDKYLLISTKVYEGISELKNKIFQSFNKIRVYTKEPGKTPSEKPIILNQGSTVKDVAEKIFHSLSNQIKEAKVTGPSSKFPNQKVSLSHELKDLDVVEFKMK